MSADTFGRIALEVPALAVALVVCLGFFTYLFKWMVSQLLDKQGQQMQRQTDAFDRQTLISQRQADELSAQAKEVRALRTAVEKLALFCPANPEVAH